MFRALKLPFVAHHLDFAEIGLPDLANFEDDPTLHSLIRSSKIPKEDDLRRRYSVDPFSKHNSRLRACSVKYNLWSERFGSGPKSAYREVLHCLADFQKKKLHYIADLLFFRCDPSPARAAPTSF